MTGFSPRTSLCCAAVLALSACAEPSDVASEPSPAANIPAQPTLTGAPTANAASSDAATAAQDKP